MSRLPCASRATSNDDATSAARFATSSWPVKSDNPRRSRGRWKPNTGASGLASAMATIPWARLGVELQTESFSSEVVTPAYFVVGVWKASVCFVESKLFRSSDEARKLDFCQERFDGRGSN